MDIRGNLCISSGNQGHDNHNGKAEKEQRDEDPDPVSNPIGSMRVNFTHGAAKRKGGGKIVRDSFRVMYQNDDNHDNGRRW